MEKIIDLLDLTKSNLTLREDKTNGVFIENVTKILVCSEKNVFQAIEIGNNNRSVSSTNMNEGSSRSHMIFIM